tara:strand:- start:3441 stop:6449 length:3009 start_codon:yes stop_codon:yes gene_type:complete
LKDHTREALEAEIKRLRTLLEQAGTNAEQQTCPDLPQPAAGMMTQATSANGPAHVQGPAGETATSSGARVSNDARRLAVFHNLDELAIILTDPAGIVTDWNAGAERVMGWRAEEMIGQSIERISTAADRATHRAKQEMDDSLHQGRMTHERWHLHKDGQQYWMSEAMSPLYADDRSHIGYMKVLQDRTSEQLAGRAIEESQQRYRLAAEATNDAIWDWDLSSNQVLWNEALEQAYGYSLADVDNAAEWWIGRIHPDDRTRIHSSIYAVIDGNGATWTDEYRFLRQDGTYAEVIDRGQVIRNAAGRAVRMIGAMLDLTRLRAVEIALRQSEERFRTILETIEAAFAIVQVKFDANDKPVDYMFLEANPAFERQAGVDLRGKWVTEFAPELEQFWFETYGHVAKTGEPASFENYAEAFERWFDVRAVRVGDPAERQIAILFSDVTQRRAAEERLRISEALARENIQRVQLALAAGAIIGTWNWHLPNDRFTVDEGFARAFGLDPALGREGLSLAQVIATVHAEDRDGLQAAIAEAISRGGAYAHQYRVRRADGRYYWIEANGRVDHALDGTPQNFPGVLIDVEHKRSIEAERDRATAALRTLNDTLEQRVADRTAALMQAEDKLRQAQKMEAVGQLTGGLAHDFNNLLAGISGALELMSLRLSQGRLDDIDRYLATAQGAAKRAASVTHRLLAFSRRQTLDPRPIDANLLVEGMTELIQRTVGPSIQVNTVSADDLWSASVDASQLESAILNLCLNSRDAMPDGGRITIETANRWLEGESARAYDVPEGQYLSLSVTDTGTGMTPAVITKAFEPFFTTKPIGQGTGLGLSMIYGFANQSGGQVRIDSELGRGTRVSLFLPRYRGDVTEPIVAPACTDSVLGEARGTILIVDDEPTVRLFLMDVLGELGYTLIEAADSIGGLKVLQSDVNIDLLITDVGLPGGMNGRQMADAGREVRADLKTLFITGYAESAALGYQTLGPGMQVLTKPFAIDTLTTRVQGLMTR